MAVKVFDNTALVKNAVDNRIGLSLRLMLEGVHRKSNPITPKRFGHLRAAVAKSMLGNRKGVIEWMEPYAKYQERGPKEGVIWHYTTAGTHAQFAENSIKEVNEEAAAYFRLGGLTG